MTGPACTADAEGLVRAIVRLAASNRFDTSEVETFLTRPRLATIKKAKAASRAEALAHAWEACHRAQPPWRNRKPHRAPSCAAPALRLAELLTGTEGALGADMEAALRRLDARLAALWVAPGTASAASAANDVREAA